MNGGAIPAPADPDFRAGVRRRFDQSPVCGFFGFEVEAVEPGEIRLGIAARPELGHRPGWFQGTISAALVEYAGSYACYTLLPDDWDRLTLDFTIKFVGPARGDRLVAQGRIIAAGRTMSTATVDVHAWEGEVARHCATGLVSVRHTPPRPA